MKAVELHSFEMPGSKVPEMAKDRIEDQIIVSRSRGPRFKLDYEVQRMIRHRESLVGHEVWRVE
jgi:hypothetical protein